MVLVLIWGRFLNPTHTSNVREAYFMLQIYKFNSNTIAV